MSGKWCCCCLPWTGKDRSNQGLCILGSTASASKQGCWELHFAPSRTSRKQVLTGFVHWVGLNKAAVAKRQCKQKQPCMIMYEYNMYDMYVYIILYAIVIKWFKCDYIRHVGAQGQEMPRKKNEKNNPRILPQQAPTDFAVFKLQELGRFRCESLSLKCLWLPRRGL